MSVPQQLDDIVDLTRTTLRDLHENMWTDLTSTFQRHVALNEIFSDEKITYGSGYGLEWRVQIGDSGNAGDSTPFAVEDVNIEDTAYIAQVPYRRSRTSFAIEEPEIDANSGERQIVDLIKWRRHDALVSFANHLEKRFWELTPTTSSDKKTPWSVNMWLVRWPSGTTTPGFTGQNPAGFSEKGSIDASTVEEWRNWAGKYATVDKTDLLPKMREAYIKTDFQPPFPQPSTAIGGRRCGIYCAYDELAQFESIAENQNENLGNDIASKDGKAMFRQVSITYVPKLDEDDGAPIYGIDWSYFRPFFQEGYFMKMIGPRRAELQPMTMKTWYFMNWNTACKNPRSQWVLSTTNSAGGSS